MAKLGVVILLTALEVVALLDVALLIRDGRNPLAFVLIAITFTPWLVVEARGLAFVARIGVRRTTTAVPEVLTIATQLAQHSQPNVPGPPRIVHTAATHPTGKRMAA